MMDEVCISGGARGLPHKRSDIHVFWRRKDGSEYGKKGYREKALLIFSVVFGKRFNQLLSISG